MTRPANASSAFTDADARTFFLAWAHAARTADAAWFDRHLADGFLNVVRPLGLLIAKPAFLALVATPRGVDLDVVETRVACATELATATTVAFVREDLDLGPTKATDARAEAEVFVAQLRHGTQVLYQTAWTRAAEWWQCVQQTVIGLVDEMTQASAR